MSGTKNPAAGAKEREKAVHEKEQPKLVRGVYLQTLYTLDGASIEQAIEMLQSIAKEEAKVGHYNHRLHLESDDDDNYPRVVLRCDRLETSAEARKRCELESAQKENRRQTYEKLKAEFEKEGHEY